MATILLVEDELELARVVTRELESAGFGVRHAADGETALRSFADEPPDIVVLDWMLPGIDGLEVLRRLRQQSALPVLMLTARAEEVDRVIGLEVGADDYLSKPFGARELVARVRALLRRHERLQEMLAADRAEGTAALSLGPLLVDPTAHLARLNGDPLELTRTEFGLLHLLLRNKGRAFSRAYLHDAVWGEPAVEGDRSVDNTVLRLRKKLGELGDAIETVWGVGYRLAGRARGRDVMRVFARLRWQLTLSHLLATAFTLLSMIAAVLLIAGGWWASQNNTSREPMNDARSVAGVIGGVVESGSDAAQLSGILRALQDGGLKLTLGFSPDERRGPTQVGLRDVAYIVVIDPSGTVLASSDATGAAFAPAESSEWRPLAATADANGSMRVRNGDGPRVLAAAPIHDQAGRHVADVVLAKNSVPPPAADLDILRGLAIFGAASVAVLGAASIFALVSSSVVAYLLSRRLVTRLERLGRAAEALAAGDLSQRVDDGPDEVGQLARRFNSMAGDLESTLGELRAERDRVAGLLEERRQLVASASHELRTPVATVRGYLESVLGRGGELSIGMHNDLETMQRELLRLQQLIDDLFALSQAAVGRLSLRLVPTDTGAVVRRLVETTAPLAWRQRRVQVLAEVADDAPAARADDQRLEQVVSNLLGNAIRHTPPGGLVAAAVSGEPGAVRLDVRDTGEGIAAEDISHVFERFFRGRSQNGEAGAGLGLALVKELTEAMGGSVEASSTPGEGSVFTVRLPRAS